MQEPGLQPSCITCTEPHGECVAALCRPEIQTQMDAIRAKARSDLAKELQAKARAKKRFVNIKKEITKAHLQVKKENAMLRAAINNRETEGEVFLSRHSQ